MSRLLGNLGVLGAIFCWGVQVNAQAAPAGVALGLERGFGISNTQVTAEQAGNSATSSLTEVGLGVGVSVAATSLARLGIDYIMDSGVSLGTAIGADFKSTGRETETSGSSASSDGPSSTLFLLSPRVGCVAQVTDSLALWPRGGLTYAQVNSERGDDSTRETSESELYLTLEVPLVILPAKNFGFLIAPTLDFGLSHSREDDGTESEVDVSVVAVGLRFGVVGVL